MRTSYKGRVQRSGQGNIGAKLSAAFQKPAILKAWESGANSELAHGKLLAIKRSRSGRRAPGGEDFQNQSGFCIQCAIALSIA
jgi:hypothetical protein